MRGRLIVCLLAFISMCALAKADCALENEFLSVIIQDAALEMTVLDKTTGETWTHLPTGGGKLNKTWTAFASSGLTVTAAAGEANAKQYSFAGEAQWEEVSDTSALARVAFDDLQIGLSVRYTLDGASLILEIPDDAITESPEGARLQTVTLYPFLGASGGLTEGFLLVPDGCGAILDTGVRTAAAQPYQASVYGEDLGIQGDAPLRRLAGMPAPERILMPVFGLNRSGRGFLASIESGSEYAVISAYLSGVTTDYNWISCKFSYRDFYFQPAAKDSASGVTLNQTERNACAAKMRYTFLADASVMGMADVYRARLLSQGVLHENGDAPKTLSARLLVADSEPSLLGRAVIPMTTGEQALNMLNDLAEIGYHDVNVELIGLSSGGMTGESPVAGALYGGDEGWKSLAQKYPLFARRDYVKAYAAGAGVSSADLAQGIGGQLVSLDLPGDARRRDSRDYAYFRILRPSATVRFMEKDSQKWENLGFAGVSLATMGERLISCWGKEKSSRADTARTYQSAIRSLPFKIALSAPNAYLWEKCDIMYDMPDAATMYLIENESVPFAQAVLSGCVSLYASPVNDEGDHDAYYLRLLANGLLPSVFLTWEDPSLLQNADARLSRSSKYSILREYLIDAAQKYLPAFEKIKGLRLTEYERLAPSVTRTQYGEALQIVVNMGDTDYVSPDGVVPAGSYLIKEAEGK